MSLVFSDFGIVTLIFLVVAYSVSTKVFTLGAMSLPCMLLMTSFIYFFLMPALAFADGRAEFLGLVIDSLEWPHLAVGLYAAAGTAACYGGRRTLAMEPVASRPTDRPINGRILLVLAVACVLSVFALIAFGRLNPFGEEGVEWAEGAENLKFVNLFLTMMIPLTIVYLIRSNFSLVSVAILAAVCVIFLLSGFRYRLILLAFAVTATFLMVKRLKISTPFVLGATFLGLLGTNFLVNARDRGRGLDLGRIEGMTWLDILKSFGGEVGPLFSFSNVANYPIREFFYFDPWLVGVARLVPTFIWPNKPTPDYLYVPLQAFPADAVDAGVAIPQHAEILLQFGWIGLPLVVFLYFRLAIYLLDRLSRLGREARITAFALVPVFFGFYMPTRGYFFQILSDGLFTFGPLFPLHAFTCAKAMVHAETSQMHVLDFRRNRRLPPSQISARNERSRRFSARSSRNR